MDTVNILSLKFKGIKIMSKGILRQLDKVLKNVNKEISANASYGRFAAALANEGYAGGYHDAMCQKLCSLVSAALLAPAIFV